MTDKPHKTEVFEVVQNLNGFRQVVQNKSVTHEVMQDITPVWPEKLIKPRHLPQLNRLHKIQT